MKEDIEWNEFYEKVHDVASAAGVTYNELYSTYLALCRKTEREKALFSMIDKDNSKLLIKALNELE